MPASANLSVSDLAALAASVRLSPDVTVIRSDPSAGQGSGVTVTNSGSSSAVASSSAAPSPPATIPIEVDPADTVTATLDAASKTMTIEFTLRNTTDGSPNLTKLDVQVPGLAEKSVQVRLDNLPSDADTQFQDAVLPAMLAPHIRVRVQVTLSVEQCSAVTDAEPQLHMEWEFAGGSGSTGGGSAGDLVVGSAGGIAVTGSASGMRQLLKPICG